MILKLKDIIKRPTSTSDLASMPGERFDNVHESIFRSYAILQYTKYLLSQGTPPHIVLEIIEDIEEFDSAIKEEMPQLGRGGIKVDSGGTVVSSLGQRAQLV